MGDSSRDWDDLLAGLEPGVAALVTAADELVRRTDPDVVRTVWPHQKTVGYGVGPKKMSEHYAYVTTHARHINLGCNYGAHLDHGGWLQGSGKNMRSATIRTPADLEDSRAVSTLQAARRERLAALGRA